MSHHPNPLRSRQQVADFLQTLLANVDRQFHAGETGIRLGETCAHYGAKIAEMEALSRMMWGIFPLMAGGDTVPGAEKYFRAIADGCNPQHANYWGDAGPFDQRIVEMAAYGVGMSLLKKQFTDLFPAAALHNLHRWLDQSGYAEMPENNWNYFAIMVQLGFKQAGLPWDRQVIEQRFNRMEAYYLGNGWYSDGPGRPKDYYISMAFHYYGLIYASLMAEEDAPRASELRARANRFAHDFITLFAADGAAVPFGRSLTYRFAEAAFWSAAAFARLEAFSPGVYKGLILRHLRWWSQQPIFDRDGILTIGYAYSNLVMAEDYNSPGSPYWALKLFLVMALPEQDAFWQAEELPLPSVAPQQAIIEADQIVVHHPHSAHVYMLTSGQIELNNYVNTEAKYTKFAYSSHYGFTVERGRYGLKHAACDSMLLLSEGDNYYRGRRECEAVKTTQDAIWSRWRPWHDVQVESWLIPCGVWHLRVHRLTSARTLHSAEGGFAVRFTPDTQIESAASGCTLRADNGISSLVNLPAGRQRAAQHIVTPPNSSLMFAESAAIPLLSAELAPGEHWLSCAVRVQPNHENDDSPLPELRIESHQLRIICPQREIILALSGE